MFDWRCSPPTSGGVFCSRKIGKICGDKTTSYPSDTPQALKVWLHFGENRSKITTNHSKIITNYYSGYLLWKGVVIIYIFKLLFVVAKYRLFCLKQSIPQKTLDFCSAKYSTNKSMLLGVQWLHPWKWTVPRFHRKKEITNQKGKSGKLIWNQNTSRFLGWTSLFLVNFARFRLTLRVNFRNTEVGSWNLWSSLTHGLTHVAAVNRPGFYYWKPGLEQCEWLGWKFLLKNHRSAVGCLSRKNPVVGCFFVGTLPAGAFFS